MQVQPAGNTPPASQVAVAASKNYAAAPVQAQAAPKKDTLILSEQARDLAALKAGKAAQEEMSESLTAKMKEGDTD